MHLNEIIGGALTWWIFSAIVSGMPRPPKHAHYLHVWAYRSLNLLAANIEKARGGRE